MSEEANVVVKIPPIEKLAGNADFIEWAGETVVGLGVFDLDFGNPQNVGVRAAALAILNEIALNPDVDEANKQKFARAMMARYQEKKA